MADHSTLRHNDKIAHFKAEVKIFEMFSYTCDYCSCLIDDIMSSRLPMPQKAITSSNLLKTKLLVFFDFLSKNNTFPNNLSSDKVTLSNDSDSVSTNSQMDHIQMEVEKIEISNKLALKCDSDNPFNELLLGKDVSRRKSNLVSGKHSQSNSFLNEFNPQLGGNIFQVPTDKIEFHHSNQSLDRSVRSIVSNAGNTVNQGSVNSVRTESVSRSSCRSSNSSLNQAASNQDNERDSAQKNVQIDKRGISLPDSKNVTDRSKGAAPSKAVNPTGPNQVKAKRKRSKSKKNTTVNPVQNQAPQKIKNLPSSNNRVNHPIASNQPSSHNTAPHQNSFETMHFKSSQAHQKVDQSHAAISNSLPNIGFQYEADSWMDSVPSNKSVTLSGDEEFLRIVEVSWCNFIKWKICLKSAYCCVCNHGFTSAFEWDGHGQKVSLHGRQLLQISCKICDITLFADSDNIINYLFGLQQHRQFDYEVSKVQVK